MTPTEAAERLFSNDIEYWWAHDKLPDAAADARQLATLVSELDALVTPEVREAVKRLTTPLNIQGERDLEVLTNSIIESKDFALAVVAKLEGK